MKKQNIKQFYNELLVRKYDNNSSLFLDQIKDENHIFWATCREFSKEILCVSDTSVWLSLRVHGFAINTKLYIIGKFYSCSRTKTLSNNLDSLEMTIDLDFDMRGMKDLSIKYRAPPKKNLDI